jgi:hypothetical protein
MTQPITIPTSCEPLADSVVNCAYGPFDAGGD